RGEFGKVRSLLADFYLTVKSCSGAFRFVFVTGIARFPMYDLGLGNLLDVSLAPEFGTLLGLTPDDLRVNFGARLEAAAATAHPEIAGAAGRLQALISDLEAMYGGYCFDRLAGARVLCPWSVLCYLAMPSGGMGGYWIDSGGGVQPLQRYLRAPAREAARERLAPEADLADCASGDAAFLAQTGYLTIKSCAPAGFLLGCPNGEVRRALAELGGEAPGETPAA
ncbi:MAG: AAA family ATPase, partial [Duodenibacillus sp.]|nr:AAA family ATPase [Duodenibacillus sp.]